MDLLHKSKKYKFGDFCVAYVTEFRGLPARTLVSITILMQEV